MDFYKRVIEWITEINNSDFGMWFSFISMIAGIIGTIKMMVAFTRKNAHSIIGYTLLIGILLLGLIWPLLLLLSTNWFGWKHILLNIGVIYALLNLIFLLYIIKAMSRTKPQFIHFHSLQK
jgi:hypothetical protein